MESTIGLVAGFAGVVVSAIIGAINWQKIKLLRKLPFYYCVVFGVAYWLITVEDRSWINALQILGGFGLVGLIAYLWVWVECREKGDRFI
jgi:hypothetical protein